MKFYIILLLFISSCFGSPTDPKKEEELELLALWVKDTNPIDVPNVPPLVIDNTKLVYAGEIELVSLEINTGEEVWRAFIDGERALESKVLLYNNLTNRIISNHNKEIKVWNVETGELVQTLSGENGILAFERGRNTIINDGYAIIGDTLDAYIINNDGSVRFRIEVDFGTLGLGYDDQKVFLAQGKTINGGLSKGKIRAFNSQTGDSLWIYETDNGGFGGAFLVVVDNVVYAGTSGNSPNSLVVALNTETGEIIWEYISGEPKEYAESLFMGPNLVYSGASGALIALNRLTGQKVWRFDWSSSTIVSPVYLEGYIYHSDHNRLFVIEAETGELIHEEPVPTGGAFFWELAVSHDKIIAQTSTQLIAYQPWHLREE